MVLAWENLQEVFVMLVVVVLVVFTLLEVFHFIAFRTTSAAVFNGRFLPYTLSFVTQMRAGTPHLRSFSVLALRELSHPADAWT